MARLLIVPGLHDSEPDHWQSWLQRFSRDAVRVVQQDWGAPDLQRWSARIGATLAQEHRLAREQRPQRASLLEWSFAV